MLCETLEISALIPSTGHCVRNNVSRVDIRASSAQLAHHDLTDAQSESKPIDTMSTLGPKRTSRRLPRPVISPTSSPSDPFTVQHAARDFQNCGAIVGLTAQRQRSTADRTTTTLA